MIIPKNSTANSGSNSSHALLSPSGSKKWLGCAASLAVEKDIPNPSNPAAAAGTAMHNIAERILNMRLISSYKTMRPASDYIGEHVMPDGEIVSKPKKGSVTINDDMAGQIQKYLDYIEPLFSSAELLRFEMRINLSRVFRLASPVYDQDGNVVKDRVAPLQTFGTGDLVAIVRRSNGTYMLIVGDLKTGRHRVEAKENSQAMIYALGLLRVYASVYDISLVRLVIFQPYCGGASEWDTTPAELEEFEDYAVKRAEKAIACVIKGKKNLKASDFTPSAGACQWCRFNDKCNARTKATAEMMNADLSNEDPTAGAEMTPAQLAKAYDQLPAMRQHIANIEKAVYGGLMQGKKIPGLKLVEGKEGARSWVDDIAAEALVEILVKEGVKPAVAARLVRKSVLLSPTEVEKVVPANAYDAFGKFITRKAGSPSVARADDNRKEWMPVKSSDLDD